MSCTDSLLTPSRSISCHKASCKVQDHSARTAQFPARKIHRRITESLKHRRKLLKRPQLLEPPVVSDSDGDAFRVAVLGEKRLDLEQISHDL